MHFIPSDASAFSNLKIDTNTFFTPTDSNFITASVKKCELELIYKDELYEELISAEVSRMLIKLKRQLRERTSGYHADVLKALRLDVYRNPDRYISSVNMAETVHLSRSRFAVVYKDFFGVSPKSDLIHARISKASYLLSLGALSLTEIAEACGYQNIYHFIRQFRAVIGITPGTYRKNY